MRRWERDIIQASMRSKTHTNEEDITAECQKLTNEATRSVENCIVLLRNDEETLGKYVEQLKLIESEIEKNVPKKKKNEILEEILGVRKPEKIDVNNPKGIRNKGSGSNKRMQGYGEKTQKANERPYKKCSVCKKLVNDHDRRTCRELKVQQNTTNNLPEEGVKTRKSTYHLRDEDSDYEY